MMRIAFTGSHRVGKTTLAEEMAESLSGYDFRSEPYFQLEEAGYLFSEVPTLDDYIEQFHFSVAQIKNSGNDVVFDRCPLDILAYIYVLSEGKNIETLYAEMATAISQIDVLVFVPIETPDLIRCQESDLPELRQEVNTILKDWIGELNNDVLEVTGTLVSRKRQVWNKIDQWKERRKALR